MASSLGINPHERGLTGLKTWLWVDDAAEELAWTQTGRPGLTKDCDPLPTPQAAFAVTVESWTFDIAAEHESASYTSNGPGTEADPAAAHTFQHVGVYPITLTATLRGDLHGEVVADQGDYEVVEVRPA